MIAWGEKLIIASVFLLFIKDIFFYKGYLRNHFNFKSKFNKHVFAVFDISSFEKAEIVIHFCSK